MSNLQHFTVATYSADGEQLTCSDKAIAELDAEQIAGFSESLKNLSGDLELPFEEKLPGQVDYIEYRIGSDLNGAYLLYYFHDEVVFASLLLSGNEDEQETELMQVFKFLLLDSNDEDEPTEEAIETVLALDAFDFPSVSQRPAVFQIQLSDRSDEEEACRHIAQSDMHLAAAFFAIDRD